MTTLTWLHLSDWHQKVGDFDQRIVRDALIADIRARERIDPALEQVDFIIFSGDLARGGEKVEFKAARENLLEPVLATVGLGPERLFIVPGNHDFPRALLDKLPAELRKSPGDNLSVQGYLVDGKRRKLALKPFKGYRSFVSRYTKQDSPDYASVLCLATRDGQTKVALLGLNSAWMCARTFVRGKGGQERSDDERRLVVGEPQIQAALEKTADADIRIAVLHHPFEWLAKFDRGIVEARLERECHFILHGHEHEPKAKTVRGAGGGDCAIIPAGACFSGRVVGDIRHVSAYNWVHLDLTAGKGMVYFRQWNESHGKWIAGIFINDDGKFPLDRLPKGLSPPTSSSSAFPPEDGGKRTSIETEQDPREENPDGSARREESEKEALDRALEEVRLRFEARKRALEEERAEIDARHKTQKRMLDEALSQTLEERLCG
uniref:Calcineurin-like phosphoesterase n=1 Tax=Candidatus Kentrum sp. FM TaxID=2126340 RepID=A0A450S1I8_9GAMM|nr:MAG: Calcineurin-like phosphoesterase [Candidatus Kentron sp. FM]VFJ49206.1 MAG: Calcineurin-like phosphoesterase [Candidatus Kentron sp. FM]VFK10023.1 MAG: Calcineurin-like phosphoesterase [Candidatus Kentron sp. FM]